MATWQPPAPSRAPRLWHHPLLHLSLATGLLFAGVNVMAPNLTSIANDLGFSKADRDRKLGGDVNAAFWLIGAPLSLVFGYLADTYSRRLLFVATVVAAQVPALFAPVVTEYWELLLIRCVCGVCVSGIVPILYSMLADLCAPEQRATASAVVGSAMGGGLLGGQVVAGVVGQWLGWRVSFVVLAVPALVFALTTYVYVAEPARGGTEAALRSVHASGGRYSPSLDWEAFVGLFQIRTNLLVFLQGLPGTIPQAVLSVYLNDFLVQDKGLGLGAATGLVVVTGLGAAVGGLGGSFFGQHIYSLRRALLPLFMGACTILGVIPLHLVIVHDFRQGWWATAAAYAFAAGALTNVSGNNLRTILLNVNMPGTRGTAFCVFNLATSIGRGAGPAIVSGLITRMGGRAPALSISLLFWVVCGVLILGVASTLSLDEMAVGRSLHRISSWHNMRHAPKSSRVFVHRRLDINSHAPDSPVVYAMV